MPKLFNNRIVARVADGNSVQVRVNYSRALIRFLGASCKASIMPGDDCVNSLTLFPEPGKRAIVALAVWNREKMPDDWTHAYSLDITWKDGGLPWLDLDEAWIPSGDQPAQVSEWGVSVQIGGVIYSSCHIDADDQSATLRDVPDGNLLCRYLAGDATAEQVVAAAEAFKEEETLPMKYANLQKRIVEKMNKIAELETTSHEKIRALEALNQGADQRIASLQQQLTEANNAFAQSQKELRDKCQDLERANSSLAQHKGLIHLIKRRAMAAKFGDREKVLREIVSAAQGWS